MNFMQFIINIFSTIRIKLYKYKILKSHSFNIPIISVGNISMGGTGKTPMVGWLINELISYNIKPCIITRGYGRSDNKTIVVNKNKNYTADQVGDEPLSIIKEYPQITMVVGSNKIQSINRAIKELDIDVIIMDDGFQSLYVKRDLDIVMINLNDQHKIIRESMVGLDRANVIIFKPCDESADRANNILAHIKDNKILKMRARSVFSFQNTNNIKDLGSVVAVCGISDSESFKNALQNNNIDVNQFLRYNNHHNYTAKDMNSIYNIMEKVSCTAMITTSKDYYKLNALNKGNKKIIVLKMELNFLETRDGQYNTKMEFTNLLKQVIGLES